MTEYTSCWEEDKWIWRTDTKFKSSRGSTKDMWTGIGNDRVCTQVIGARYQSRVEIARDSSMGALVMGAAYQTDGVWRHCKARTQNPCPKKDG